MKLIKNKRGQEIETGPLIMAVLGAVIAWVMAGRMMDGLFIKIVATLGTGVVCYFIALNILNR
jgi:hypothetical protein